MANYGFCKRPFKRKLGKGEIRKIGPKLEDNDLLTLLVFSFSCPELIEPNERTLIEEAFEAKSYGVLDFYDKEFRTRQMMASYLAPDIEVPWKNDAELAEKIRNILVAMWNFSVAGSQNKITHEELYQSVREYNRGTDRFDNSFNIFSDVEPIDAMRLNVEIANLSQEEARMRIYIQDRFEKVARMFAILQAGGHHTSVKFTTSDYENGVTYGKRFCIYVPTCAIERTISALKDAGLTDGALDLNHLCDRSSSVFRLPGLAVFRSTGEAGTSSIAQANEALDALKTNRIRYGRLSFGIPPLIANGRYRRLEDGTTIDLFEKSRKAQ